MKANRKFMKDEEGVSPVIAVILMVAITVVLAATVFVLVSNIGKNVGSTGPQFQMISGTQTSSAQWIVRVAAVNVKHDFTDYQFVLTLPNLTKVTIDPIDNADFNAGSDCWQGTIAATSAGALVAATTGANTGTPPSTLVCPAASNGADARLVFKDVSGDDKFSTGDEVTISYDDGDADDTHDDTFASGEWLFELRHKSTDTLAGSLTRTA